MEFIEYRDKLKASEKVVISKRAYLHSQIFLNNYAYHAILDKRLRKLMESYVTCFLANNII